jgi:hypothetical protein
MKINNHTMPDHSTHRTLKKTAAAVAIRAARPILLATVGFGLILGGAGAANAMPNIPPGGDTFQRECGDLVNQIRGAVQDYYNGPRTPETLQAAKDKIGPAAQTYNQIGCASVFGPLDPKPLPAPRRAVPPAGAGNVSSIA